MIASILWVTLPGFLLGAAGMALASRKVPASTARGRWLKLIVYFAIVHVVLLAAALGPNFLRSFMVFAMASCGLELVLAWRKIPRPRPRGVWVLAAMIGASVIAAANRVNPGWLVWSFIVVACGDGFGQIVGQLAGRHPLVPRLSPAKTIEGAVGGLAAAILAGAALHALIGLPIRQAGCWALAVGLAGQSGDLLASWVKRRAGIKDYSRALPGHGGFLDRFDSLAGGLALLSIVRW